MSHTLSHSKHPKKTAHTQKVKDVISGEEWAVKAKVVVNATGVFADGIRKMDDPDAIELIEPAAGACFCVVCVRVRVSVLGHWFYVYVSTCVREWEWVRGRRPPHRNSTPQPHQPRTPRNPLWHRTLGRPIDACRRARDVPRALLPRQDGAYCAQDARWAVRRSFIACVCVLCRFIRIRSRPERGFERPRPPCTHTHTLTHTPE